MKSSKETLECVGLSGLGFLPNLQFPILQNATQVKLTGKKLNFINPNESFYSLLPRYSTFSYNFPQLSSVKFNNMISLWEENMDTWTKIFPTTEIVPTVRNLEIEYGVSEIWANKITEMFPNVQHLVFGKIIDVIVTTRIIWESFKKLVSLKLEIQPYFEANVSPALDSAFIGIPLEKCLELYHSPVESFDGATGQEMNLVTNPSIVQLQGK